MSVISRLSRDFPVGDRSRGNQYYREGRVILESSRDDRVTAKVEGNSGDYDVALDFSRARQGTIRAACTCPRYGDAGCCKHIWATILTAEEELESARFPRSGRLFVESADSLLGDEDSDGASFGDIAASNIAALRDRLLATLGGGRIDSKTLARLGGAPKKTTPSRTPRKAKAPKSLRWKTLLNSLSEPADDDRQRRETLPLLKTRETWFALDLSRSWQFGIVIELFQREMKQTGEFGVFKALSLGLPDLQDWSDPDEADLLGMLMVNDQSSRHWGLSDQYSYRYGYGYDYGGQSPKKSTFLLAPAAYQQVLPRLCATERFLWTLSPRETLDEQGNLVTWDDGPPWRFQLAVASDERKKEWVISGQLARKGAPSPLPLDKPELLCRDGLVLSRGALAAADFNGVFPWIRLLRKESEIRVPFASRNEFLERIWSQPRIPEIEGGDGLRLAEVRVPPVGVIRIFKPKTGWRETKLHAKVSFAYERREATLETMSAGLVDGESGRVLLRDPVAERNLFLSLGLLGLRRPTYSDDTSCLEFPAAKLSKVVQALTEAGWTVEAEGNLIRRAGEFRLSVTSGVDWFELDGECDFGGVTAKLPDLLAALRKGERYVRLGDGSQGMLPEEWLKKFGNLAAMGETEDGQVRFRPSQALLLDALLASQPQAAVDEQFVAYRRKLQSFSGVKPREEPGGFVGTLRDYQKDGLGWLNFLREFGFGGCLADDMGLGKTIQVLALLQEQRRCKPNEERRPSLVVVPRSLVFNWMEEAARFAPELKVLDFAHTQRGELLPRIVEHDLVLATYGTLLRDITTLKNVPFEYAILDEAQAIKNAQSQSAKACRLLAARHRLALTGTPIENHLGELWSLFEFLNPGMLGRSEAFRRFTKDGESGPSNLPALAKAVAPFVLRRTKEQVLKELPAKTEQTIFCDLSKKERKQYNDLRDFYKQSLTSRIESQGLARSKIHVLEALLRLRQAACHTGLLDSKRKSETSAKLETLLEQLEEIVAEGHKVLVFSQFTSLLDIVRSRLDSEEVVYEYLDGQTRDRQKRVERFQNDPKCPVFLISLKAGGRGLNLTAADYVFILDPWWNPAVEAQAVDRAHRIGQTRRVFAYRLIARDTVEEKILELQKSKRELADAIITADGSMLQNLTADDLRVLLS